MPFWFSFAARPLFRKRFANLASQERVEYPSETNSQVLWDLADKFSLKRLQAKQYARTYKISNSRPDGKDALGDVSSS